MDKPIILIIDGDPKNLQILKESFESSEFEVITVSNGNDAWGMLQSQKPDIIVSEVDIPGIDGFQLLTKLQKDPAVASIPLVFLTNRRNLEDRIKSLRSGVKDYLIKPLHVKEVIARIQMILNRLERLKHEEVESSRKMVGQLEDRSVEQLVESFGVERKTGILTVYDESNRSGEIYFRDGAVVNASFGNFKAEKAVYQMLSWKKGHFIMIFKEINIEDEISVSNLGLLLQSFKRLQEQQKFIKQLPPFDSVFIKSTLFQQILKKRAITTDANKFISLFDGKRTISDIIADSTYDDLKTLERITKLYQQGFIQPLGSEYKQPHLAEELPKPLQAFQPKSPTFKKDSYESEKNTLLQTEQQNKLEDDLKSKIRSRFAIEDELEPEIPRFPFKKTEELYPVKPAMTSENKMFQDSSFADGKAKYEVVTKQNSFPTEFTSICDELFKNRTTKTGHLVIISSNHKLRKEFLSILTRGHFSTKTIEQTAEQSIELGKIETPNQHTLEILSISTETRFLQMLDQLSTTLIGYVVLVAGENSSNLGYMGYLINSLKVKLKVPHVVAVYYPSEKKSMPLDIIRHGLQLNEDEQLVEIDIRGVESIKHLLTQLIPPEYSKNSIIDKKNIIQETA
ncbi:MAG: response regulator [bacterium]